MANEAPSNSAPIGGRPKDDCSPQQNQSPPMMLGDSSDGVDGKLKSNDTSHDAFIKEQERNGRMNPAIALALNNTSSGELDTSPRGIKSGNKKVRMTVSPARKQKTEIKNAPKNNATTDDRQQQQTSRTGNDWMKEIKEQERIAQESPAIALALNNNTSHGSLPPPAAAAARSQRTTRTSTPATQTVAGSGSTGQKKTGAQKETPPTFQQPTRPDLEKLGTTMKSVPIAPSAMPAAQFENFQSGDQLSFLPKKSSKPNSSVTPPTFQQPNGTFPEKMEEGESYLGDSSEDLMKATVMWSRQRDPVSDLGIITHNAAAPNSEIIPTSDTANRTVFREEEGGSLMDSRRAKKRISGPVQPGAFGAAPGMQPTRVASIRYCNLTQPGPDDAHHNPHHSHPNVSVDTTHDPTTLPVVIDVETRTAYSMGLVEATAVIGESTDIILGQADSYHGPTADEAQQNRDQKKRYYKGTIFCLAVVPIIIVLILLLSGVFEKAPKLSVVISTEAPSNAPSGSPTVAPTPFIVPLPEYTVNTLQNGPLDSPQERAYRWIRDDPNSEEYSDARKQQRFALATFYYASNGDKGMWTRQDDWMSYDVHECEWFSRWIRLGPDFPEICDEEGNYQALILTRNGLSGSLPQELVLLTKLEVFDVATNEIRGTIPSHIGLMTSLYELILDINKLTGEAPSEIGQLTRLECFFVHTNPLTGTIMTEVGLLTNMIDFEWADTSMSGTVPSEMGRLSLLEFLYLHTNSAMTGTIMTEIGLLTKMVDFQWAVTMTKGTIPTEVGLMTQMTALWLDENLLEGPLPSELGLLSNLSLVLSLYTQFLTGTIPTEIGRLTGLESLYLDANSLSGIIPSEVGSCVKAEEIFLEENDLRGTIPSELGGLTLLESIVLSSTSLSGSIPSELGRLSLLIQLNLDGTNLSGTVPAELGNVGFNRGIESLKLNDTLLTGEVPADLCDIPEVSFDCSDHLCGCDCVCQFVAQGSVESSGRPRASREYDIFDNP
ncbi:LRR receptor-like serine threonine-protein kinase [Seminavis robusta]|uniref:LRR receptor-like serine threonine-protein kinase n=1 Tax=Seminavis robusta TaxID=568900 RepID=A0A9N8HLH4_9STRA|nr:LRR receptor-like serine threonine-protein kinase [Seminavis robusta]|eukprot:Sro820_g207220.1 LRR receptor-like serine threonine-protein kinase (1001) ;mRNA; r:14250-17252